MCASDDILHYYTLVSIALYCAYSGLLYIVKFELS